MEELRDFNALQAMFDHVGKKAEEKRAQSQMTLGTLIVALQQLPQEALIVGFGEAMSYRGYYSDLSFEPSEETQTVAQLYAACRDCMGKVFMGYKGGDFLMGERTPLWLSHYDHSSGIKLMGLDTTVDPIVPVTEQEQ